MACVGSNNQNSFGILASLDIPAPNELSQVLSRNSGKKSAARDPEPAKSQRNTDQRRNVRQPCKPVPRQNGNNKPTGRSADVRTSLSSLQLPHIGFRDEIGTMSSVKTKDVTVTPPQYHLDFKTNASSLEEHRRGSVAQRLSEQFQSFAIGFFVYSRQTMFRRS